MYLWLILKCVDVVCYYVNLYSIVGINVAYNINLKEVSIDICSNYFCLDVTTDLRHQALETMQSLNHENTCSIKAPFKIRITRITADNGD